MAEQEITSEQAAVGLRDMALTIQTWLDWNKGVRDHEGIETEDGTHIMALPVPSWPSHGQLNAWVKMMKDAADLLRMPG